MPNRAQPPVPRDLTRIIRRLVEDGEVSWTEHAFDERALERGIRPRDAMSVLRIGDIEGDIVAGRKPGEWRCLIRGPLDWSSREIGVVTVVIAKRRLLIVTVEWMDP